MKTIRHIFLFILLVTVSSCSMEKLALRNNIIFPPYGEAEPCLALANIDSCQIDSLKSSGNSFREYVKLKRLEVKTLKGFDEVRTEKIAYLLKNRIDSTEGKKDTTSSKKKWDKKEVWAVGCVAAALITSFFKVTSGFSLIFVLAAIILALCVKKEPGSTHRNFKGEGVLNVAIGLLEIFSFIGILAGLYFAILLLFVFGGELSLFLLFVWVLPLVAIFFLLRKLEKWIKYKNEPKTIPLPENINKS